MFRFVALLGAACLAAATVALVAHAKNTSPQPEAAGDVPELNQSPAEAAEAVPSFHLRFSLN
jgi:hypothetical protein